MKKRLLICISSHGFGHFAMTSPIINQLIAENNFDLVLRTEVPEYLIAGRLSQPIKLIGSSSDFGMQMTSSLDVDIKRSEKAYREVHENWSGNIENEVKQLEAIEPDLILANIPYLTLAAANELGVTSLAYCSLNWAEIVASYFETQQDFVQRFIPQMNEAYNYATHFLCPAPAMSMPALSNVKSVAPVCTLGTPQKDKILEKFHLSENSKLVLISAGGVSTHIPVEEWPQVNNIVWVCAWSQRSQRQDILSLDELNMRFSDLTASIDAVVTKPGYGTVSEAACHGKPALYVKRGDWAEEPYLIDWWHKNGLVREISREQFFRGEFVESLLNLLEYDPVPPIQPDGISQVTDIINGYLKC